MSHEAGHCQEDFFTCEERRKARPGRIASDRRGRWRIRRRPGSSRRVTQMRADASGGALRTSDGLTALT